MKYQRFGQVSNSTFLDNTSENGGAILNTGAGADLTVRNATFARNASTNGGEGGAILNADNAATSVRYCTFVGNTANGNGGALLNESGTVITEESLYAGNSAANAPDFDNSVTNAGLGNAQVALTQLMPFGDYGGPTPVQPLKPTAAAKGTAFHRSLPATDQRGPGFPRTDGTGRAPGAVEGLESRDFQPDNRIGLTIARQIGNNRYNTTGQGQTVKLTLSGRRKSKTFFTVDNDGEFTDPIRVKADKPSARTLNGKVFRLTGGRRNVSAQIFRSGLALGNLVPDSGVGFQAEWSRKSKTKKAKQTVKIRSTSGIAPKSDVVGAKVGSK